MMIPILANTNFERLAEIDNYITFIWTTRYYESGDFQLQVPVNPTAVSMFQIGYYILRDDDDHVGIIEDVIIENTPTKKEVITISGRFLSSILMRRIIAVQTQVSGQVPSCIQKLINENAISPSILARQIPNLSFVSLVTSSLTMRAQYTGKNLLETISKICSTYGIGFKTILTASHSFQFTLFEGVDRSYGQSVNPYVVFSDEYDNLISSQYEESHQELVTDVLIAGEGEGLNRKTLWVTSAASSGLARYEKYQDARNTSTNDGEIDDETYYNELRGEALESITTFTSAFTGDVDFSNIKYKEDVNIGDIVTIKNTKWGIYINSRLVEVIESVSESGAYTITPSFGNYVGEDQRAILTESGENLTTETSENFILEV